MLGELEEFMLALAKDTNIWYTKKENFHYKTDPQKTVYLERCPNKSLFSIKCCHL